MGDVVADVMLWYIDETERRTDEISVYDSPLVTWLGYLLL